MRNAWGPLVSTRSSQCAASQPLGQLASLLGPVGQPAQATAAALGPAQRALTLDGMDLEPLLYC